MSVRKRFRKNVKGKINHRSVEVFLQDTHPEIIETIAIAIGRRRDCRAIDDAIDHYFWAIRFSMENDSFPEIDLGPIGRLGLSKRAVGTGLRTLLRLRKQDIYLDPEHPKKRITRLWRAWKKIKYSSRKWGRHGAPYNDWHSEMDEFFMYAPQTDIKDWRKLTTEKKGHLSHKLNPGGLFADERKPTPNHKGPLVADYTFRYNE